MPIEVRVPQVADSTATAKLAVWLKREGDHVIAGEPIAEVETDKTTVEIEAPSSGILQAIHVVPGTENLAVGDLLALIVTATDDAAGARGSSPRPSAAALDHGPSVTTAETDRVTPLARQMAAVADVDLAAVCGSGPNGRINKVDIERVLNERRRVQSPTTSESFAQPAVTGFASQPLTSIRKVTAARLQHAKQTIPHFYLTIDCSVDAMVEARAHINTQRGDGRLTITDFVVRAAALALKKVPLANSIWADDSVRLYQDVDVAVAVDTPAGLITPIVREADQKTLLMISRELQSLAERARAGDLKPHEYAGGTFTISNLGMFGVSSLYAIINPPQSCILGIGAVQPRPVVRDHRVSVGMVMTCSLSADHRVIDGATGAGLLAEFRRLVEEPSLLMLE